MHKTSAILSGFLFCLGCDTSTPGSSYDDCILRAMRGVTSDVAARSIQAACRSKYVPQPRAIDRLRIDHPELATRSDCEILEAAIKDGPASRSSMAEQLGVDGAKCAAELQRFRQP